MEQEPSSDVAGLCGKPNVTGILIRSITLRHLNTSCGKKGHSPRKQKSLPSVHRGTPIRCDAVYVFSKDAHFFFKLADRQQLTAQSTIADDTCQTRDPARADNAVCEPSQRKI